MLNVSDEIKQKTLEELTCTVLIDEKGTLCGVEASVMIQVPDTDIIMCMCNEHAYGSLVAGKSLAVQEIGERKRYFAFSGVPNDTIEETQTEPPLSQAEDATIS